MFKTGKQTNKQALHWQALPTPKEIPLEFPFPTFQKNISQEAKLCLDQSEYEHVYLKFPRSSWFLATQHENRIHFRLMDFVLNCISGTNYFLFPPLGLLWD